MVMASRENWIATLIFHLRRGPVIVPRTSLLRSFQTPHVADVLQTLAQDRRLANSRLPLVVVRVACAFRDTDSVKLVVD
jgi:hypothetical protein